MNWIEHYKATTCTADEAIRSIKSGDSVVYGHGAGVPVSINEALVRNKDNYRDVSIYHMIYLGDPIHLEPGMEKHFRVKTSFLDAATRKALEEGRADFYPCYFHQLPAMFDIGVFPVDVAVVQVSPPDDIGYCSFVVTIDYIKSAVRNAKVVIAEVNDRMPRTMGAENRIRVTQFDHIVEVSRPLREFPKVPAGETEIKIAGYCSTLIEDGSTLQIGIGAIPDTVVTLLDGRKDLGVHTELLTSGIVELIKKGIVTGKKKTFHRDKVLFTFMMGTQEAYDFVNNNPMTEAFPVDYCNLPSNVARNDKFVSINSCIEIDFTGQVASESIGSMMYSGTGGQVDFVQAARLSRGGKSILAISSTASDGTVSRITPFLKEGGVVTTSRNDVDYIITEYGIAHLRGQSLRERAKRLINIAHPKFREELDRKAFEIFKR